MKTRQIASIKNGQATYIAPLQPATLASFLTWGSSPGAGRIRLAQRKGNSGFYNSKIFPLNIF